MNPFLRTKWKLPPDLALAIERNDLPSIKAEYESLKGKQERFNELSAVPKTEADFLEATKQLKTFVHRFDSFWKRWAKLAKSKGWKSPL